MIGSGGNAHDRDTSRAQGASDASAAGGGEWSAEWIGEPDPVEQHIRELFLEGVSGATDSGGSADRSAAQRARRAELLARLSDPDHRARLVALFDAHDALPPEPARAPTDQPDPNRLIGRTFGEFTVRSLLASGGTADVYLALQRSPQREVVLKVRRARHGTDGQVRRFLAEAERLAGFSHPGVAHIYGSGVDRGDTGPVAWIAMERVIGVDLAQWRDRSAHSVADRCRLVARVAEIVAAAHATGIVHRDLAPRNITVGPDGAPRVIDYGIAHTLHSLNAHPSIEGTPGFASPEQQRGASASTGDDVYALGRLLEWIAPDAPDAALRLARAATGAQAARPPAAQFASQLAAACAPKGRRNAAVWLLAAAACVAVAVTAVSPAARQRVGALADSEAAAADAAVRSEAVARILNALLETASPTRGGTSKTTVLEAISKAEAQVMQETRAPVRVRVDALERIMELWNEYGDYAQAAATARAIAAIAEADPTTLPSLGVRFRARAAVLLAHTKDRTEAKAALDASRAELRAVSRSIGDGMRAPSGATERQRHMDYAQSHVYLALAAKLLGDLALSRDLSDIALPFHRSGVFAGTRSAVTFLINRARLELDLDNLDEAADLAAAAVAISEQISSMSDVERLDVRALQAGILESAGKLDDAAAVYRQALEEWTRIGGPNHPKVITALNNLGLNLSRQKRHDDAIPLLEDACQRSVTAHGASHQHTIDNHGNLALAYDVAGRSEDAASTLERYLPVIRESLGSPSIDEVVWLHFLADIRRKQGRKEDARALLGQVIATGKDLPRAKGNVRDARKELESLDASAPAASTAAPGTPSAPTAP
jgi:tetratricopeptide (TPR) repeat protein/tRNA A-37 threonylcarbamoyl transferase component Bud32